MSDVLMTLRPFTREEYHDFYRRYESDPVMDPNPYHYEYTHVDHCFDFDQTRADWYPIFGIFDASGNSVGCLSLKRIDRAEHRCELGLMMADNDCKNRGYGTAAIKAAIRIAHDRYDVRHVYADTMGSNTRMQHIFDKLGFRMIERIPHVYDMHDRWEDKLDYVLELMS